MAEIGDFQGLCAEYKEDLDKKDKEIERLMMKIAQAIACVEDGFYNTAINKLQQALKEE